MEYVSGTDPAVSDANAQLTISAAMELRFTRSLTADSATPLVVKSTDLTEWTNASVTPLSIVNQGNGTEQITVRLGDTPQARRFFAIRWELEGEN